MIILNVNCKQGMRYFSLVFFSCLFLISCKRNKSTAQVEKQVQKDSAISTAVETQQTNTNIPSLGALPDSGKPYFKIAVYKNNELLAQYEGDWAIALQTGKNMTIQFPASKRMLKISHGMIMYFNSPSAGSFQIASSGNEKEKPVIIFTPEIDGAYGIATSAASGTVTITNYGDSQISGNIAAAGKDEKGNEIIMQAAFINIKNNITD